MALAAILASTLAWGQQNSTVTFTSHANLVLVPVVVSNNQRTGLNYNNDLVLPPGEYSVHFVVRDNLTGRLGTVSAPLQVKP
jgi:hypothetical protein